MSTIDNITVILGPPALQTEKERLEAEAAASGESLDDTYVRRIARIANDLTARIDDKPSDLETCFAELIGRPVSITEVTPTYFEKKARRYPAIMVASKHVVDANGESLQKLVSEVFIRPESPARLAEFVGTKLDLESAKTFYTFGTGGE